MHALLPPVSGRPCTLRYCTLHPGLPAMHACAACRPVLHAALPPACSAPVLPP